MSKFKPAQSSLLDLNAHIDRNTGFSFAMPRKTLGPQFYCLLFCFFQTTPCVSPRQGTWLTRPYPWYRYSTLCGFSTGAQANFEFHNSVPALILLVGTIQVASQSQRSKAITLVRDQSSFFKIRFYPQTIRIDLAPVRHGCIPGNAQ